MTAIASDLLSALMAIAMPAESREAVINLFLKQHERVEKARSTGADRTARWRAKRDSNVTSDASQTSQVTRHKASQSVTSDASTRAEPLSSLSLVDNKKNSLRSFKGTRLSKDWAPKPVDLVEAIGLLGEPKANIEIATFRDYWPAVPGARGLKVDWDMTWRNWVRKAAERVPPPARAGPNGYLAKPSALSVLMEIENGTRKPQSDDRPDIPFGSGAGPLIEGSAYEVRERDDPGWI